MGPGDDVEQPIDQRDRLDTLVRVEPSLPDEGGGTLGRLRRLCVVVTRELPATWAGVTLVQSDVIGTIAASDGHARALEDLQFDFGEGPCLDSIRAGEPVLEPDLAGAGCSRWPAYAPEAQKLGARGVYAFPLQRGAVHVGALDVYQDRAETLPPTALASVAILAGLALGILADGQAKAADGQLDPGIQEVLDSRVEVYQAQGMIKADLGVTVIEAIALLRAHAYSVGRPLTEVARDVVEGVLRLAH